MERLPEVLLKVDLEAPRKQRQLEVQQPVARDPQPRVLQVPRTQKRQKATTIKAMVESS